MSTREAAVLNLAGIRKSTGLQISGVVGLPALNLITIDSD
jgi:hypothetical protein